MSRRRIEVAAYDPAWPGQFAAERDRLLAACEHAGVGGEVAGIEHIGSTAVPGLAAKPIIDVMIGLRAWPGSPAFITALTDLGYHHRGEAAIVARHYFTDGAPGGPRSRQLHAVVHDGHFWREHLRFRDRLRRDASARAAYAAGKRRFADAHPHDPIAYTDAKTGVITGILRRARADDGVGAAGTPAVREAGAASAWLEGQHGLGGSAAVGEITPDGEGIAPVAMGTFDAVVVAASLPVDPAAALSEAYRVLDEDGWVVLVPAADATASAAWRPILAATGLFEPVGTLATGADAATADRPGASPRRAAADALVLRRLAAAATPPAGRDG